MSAITVNTINGTVRLGANSFNDALNCVKSISGRKFNSSNKTWSVPVSIAKLSEVAGRMGCEVEEREEREDEDIQEMKRNFNPFKEGTEGHKECSQAIDQNLSNLLKKLGVNSGV